MNSVFTCVLVIVGAALLSACGSSGPKTEYYALFPSVETSPETQLIGDNLSFGIGPVILPEFLQQAAIVSRAGEQQLRVSGVHAWAGDLNGNLARVLATDLATLWAQDSVWAFPWDTRARPEYQIRIVIEDFSGERGGDVVLRARWLLLGEQGKAQLAVGSEALTERTLSASAQDYVIALNSLLKRFSVTLSLAIKQELPHYGETKQTM